MLFKPLFFVEELRGKMLVKPRVEFHMKTEAYKYRIVLITLLFCDTAPGVGDADVH